jgi:glycerol uptake facilitator-like aquaporin
VLAFAFPALGTLGRNNPGVNLGVLALGPDITVAGGVILELVMTFFLVLVIFGTAVDARGAKAVAPLAIGLTITIGILFGGRLTGAGMNPARAFGPAVVQQDFTNWWIYWVGPIVGGLIAAGLYKYLWLDSQESATVPVRRAVADVEPIAAAPETRRSASQSKQRGGRRR